MKSKTYYHVTKASNLESIMNNGLKPRIGELSKLCDECVERIYLFKSEDDMENALMNWLGENINNLYGESAEFIALKIEIPLEKCNYLIDDNESEYEAFCYDTIKPEYISYYKDV